MMTRHNSKGNNWNIGCTLIYWLGVLHLSWELTRAGEAGVGMGFDRRPCKSGYVTEKDRAEMLPFIRYRLECLLLCGLNWQRTAWPCDGSENTMWHWNHTEHFIRLCWEFANVSAMVDVIWVERWSIMIKHHTTRELTSMLTVSPQPSVQLDKKVEENSLKVEGEGEGGCWIGAGSHIPATSPLHCGTGH